MKVTLMTLLLSMALIASCSMTEEIKSTENQGPNYDRDIFSEDISDEELLENDEVDLAAEDEASDWNDDGEDLMAGTPLVEDESDLIPENNYEELTGAVGNYTVQKNDTLMMIAFKIYGKISMWKELVKWNNGIKSRKLTPGTSIKYQVPDAPFDWSPNGEPYLIVRGDTLPKISTKVYNVWSRWKEIWNNNKPLIKNPNLIYAGFTIYYVPDSPEKLAKNNNANPIPAGAQVPLPKTAQPKPAAEVKQATNTANQKRDTASKK